MVSTQLRRVDLRTLISNEKMLTRESNKDKKRSTKKRFKLILHIKSVENFLNQ